MEVISTQRFTVFDHTCRKNLRGRGLNSSESIRPAAENVRRTAAAGLLAATPRIAFEKDGESIEIPTMRLRDLNKANASRYG